MPSVFEQEAIKAGRAAAYVSNDPHSLCPHPDGWLRNAWMRGLAEELEKTAKASTAPRRD